MPGGRGKITGQEGNTWVKGQSGNPKGRPPKVLTTLVADLKKQGYERATATTVVETIEHLIGLPEDRLRELLADKEQPMSVRIIIKSMLSAKGFETLSAILDRVHGKPKQQMDVATTGEQKLEVRVKITKDDLTSDPIE